MPSAVSIVVLVASLLVLVASVVVLWRDVSQGSALPQLQVTKPAGALGAWVLVGSGLSASSFLTSLPSNVRDAVTIRESTSIVGGRALSTPLATAPPSTETPSREYGAWLFEPLRHLGVKAFIDKLNVPTISVELQTPYTFLYANGKRRPFEPLPNTAFSASQTYVSVAGSDPDLWYAHTGVSPLSCPDAAADVVQRLNISLYGTAVAGFGWQDIAIRAVGSTPVRYRRTLTDLKRLDNNRLALSYASGDTETADGVVLTLPPHALKAVTGIPEDFLKRLNSDFETVPVGIIYAAWSSQDVWWQSLGFFNGVVATTLPIGRITIVSGNEIRFGMSGADSVSFWTNLFVGKNVVAAKAAMAEQLSEVFGVKVPPPASASYNAWPTGIQLWKAGVKRDGITRPWGEDVPVFWASADITSYPALIEGAIVAGSETAEAVVKYVS